jgi:hypothetical protein
MESPQGWTALTSSLAVSTLSDISHTWAFLVVQGLVRDEGADRQVFETAVRAVAEQGEITGPSEAHRIAAKLINAGLSLPPAHRVDPAGNIADARMKLVRSWRQTES